ncbi:MAG: NUDIX hydrolase [Candidatus Pacebacteria bacterium]|nr:NUDIX hydrolase [Candidatus Paceibacterota bacterium]
MKITEEHIGYTGIKYILEYQDTDSFDELPLDRCKQCYGVCFYEDKIFIGYDGNKNFWGLVGGSVEEGESLEQTLGREVREESNTEILNFIPIGYQKVTNTENDKNFYQLRYACLVKPYGPFIADPAGSVTEIKLIDPKDYKQYFDWGKIGERIINRAIELKEKL